MKRESPAKIFNSVQREVKETTSYKYFNTFNLTDPSEEGGEYLKQFFFFNDAFLSPQESITYKHDENAFVLILPIAGALNYSDKTSKEEFIKSDQLLLMKVEKESSYTLHNVFKKDWVNYLHIGFKVNIISPKHIFTHLEIALKKTNEPFGFEFPEVDQLAGSIALYQGRYADTYTLTKTNSAVFVYVISGAFEVQGRLLEQRDGLCLWDTKEIEFEALSNNAIILILEIKSNDY